MHMLKGRRKMIISQKDWSDPPKNLVKLSLVSALVKGSHRGCNRPNRKFPTVQIQLLELTLSANLGIRCPQWIMLTRC